MNAYVYVCMYVVHIDMLLCLSFTEPNMPLLLSSLSGSWGLSPTWVHWATCYRPPPDMWAPWPIPRHGGRCSIMRSNSINSWLRNAATPLPLLVLLLLLVPIIRRIWWTMKMNADCGGIVPRFHPRCMFGWRRRRKSASGGCTSTSTDGLHIKSILH